MSLAQRIIKLTESSQDYIESEPNRPTVKYIYNIVLDILKRNNIYYEIEEDSWTYPLRKTRVRNISLDPKINFDKMCNILENGLPKSMIWDLDSFAHTDYDEYKRFSGFSKPNNVSVVLEYTIKDGENNLHMEIFGKAQVKNYFRSYSR